MIKLVSYVRVSTRRQGRSGLGEDAQRDAVSHYASLNGATVCREFREVESGKDNHRPQLATALKYARAIKAKVVIAKLDRLARNAAFVTGLLESDVEFACCDYPSANRMTLQLMAVFAEEEGRAISVRTRDALAQAKKRGARLGCNHEDWKDEWRVKGQRSLRKARTAHSERCEAHNAAALAKIQELRSEGNTLAQTADVLNAENYVTTRNKAFTPTAVHRLLARV
jgi:DNA invertase Pin-like site-specific DNA recombinase